MNEEDKAFSNRIFKIFGLFVVLAAFGSVFTTYTVLQEGVSSVSCDTCTACKAHEKALNRTRVQVAQNSGLAKECRAELSELQTKLHPLTNLAQQNPEALATHASDLNY